VRSSARRRLVPRALLTALVAAAATVSLLGNPPWAGPVLATLSSSHGVHLGDVVVAVGAVLTVAAVWLLPRR